MTRMHWVRTSADGAYRAAALAPPFLLEAPFPGLRYACLLWDAGVEATTSDRRTLARQLMASGCRYVVCGGQDGEAWCDAVDAAFGSETPPGSEPEDRLVAALWNYPEETPEEVGQSFLDTPDLKVSALRKFLVLVLGADLVLADRLFTSVQSGGTGEPR